MPSRINTPKTTYKDKEKLLTRARGKTPYVQRNRAGIIPNVSSEIKHAERRRR